MGELDEEIKTFYAISKTAQGMSPAAIRLRDAAINLAVRHAKEVLMAYLTEAISISPEFSHDVLRERLLDYFSQPERVYYDENQGIIIDTGGEDSIAGQEWINAQMAANEARRTGKELGGWAVNPSLAQKRAYWQHYIYPSELYDQTIQERLEFIGGEEAPFWYFLEYGTGPYAYPQSKGTFFLLKTRREVGGRAMMKSFEDQAAGKFDEELSKQMLIMIGTTAKPIEEIKWSVWYTWRGKQIRHQYSSRGFVGIREVAK